MNLDAAATIGITGYGTLMIGVLTMDGTTFLVGLLTLTAGGALS